MFFCANKNKKNKRKKKQKKPAPFSMERFKDVFGGDLDDEEIANVLHKPDIKHEIIPVLRRKIIKEVAGSRASSAATASQDAFDSIFGEMPSVGKVVNSYGRGSEIETQYREVLERMEANEPELFDELFFDDSSSVKLPHLKTLVKYLNILSDGRDAWDAHWQTHKPPKMSSGEKRTKKIPSRPLDLSRMEEIFVQVRCLPRKKVLILQQHTDEKWYRVEKIDYPTLLAKTAFQSAFTNCAKAQQSQQQKKGMNSPWSGINVDFWDNMEPFMYARAAVDIMYDNNARKQIGTMFAKNVSNEEMDQYLYKRFMHLLKQDYCSANDCEAIKRTQGLEREVQKEAEKHAKAERKTKASEKREDSKRAKEERKTKASEKREDSKRAKEERAAQKERDRDEKAQRKQTSLKKYFKPKKSSQKPSHKKKPSQKPSHKKKPSDKKKPSHKKKPSADKKKPSHKKKKSSKSKKHSSKKSHKKKTTKKKSSTTKKKSETKKNTKKPKSTKRASSKKFKSKTSRTKKPAPKKSTKKTSKKRTSSKKSKSKTSRTKPSSKKSRTKKTSRKSTKKTSKSSKKNKHSRKKRSSSKTQKAQKKASSKKKSHKAKKKTSSKKK